MGKLQILPPPLSPDIIAPFDYAIMCYLGRAKSTEGMIDGIRMSSWQVQKITVQASGWLAYYCPHDRNP